MQLLEQINEAVSKKAQKELLKEWRSLSEEVTVMSTLTKILAKRVDEIETILTDVAKGMEDNKAIIDNCIVEAAQRKTTSVSYQDAFNEALRVVNEETKEALASYLESITKRGFKDVLKIVDPKLEKALQGVNKLTPEELRLRVEEIAKLRNHGQMDEGIIANIKAAIKKLGTFFKEIMNSFTGMTSAAKKLEAVVAQPE